MWGWEYGIAISKDDEKESISLFAERVLEGMWSRDRPLIMSRVLHVNKGNINLEYWYSYKSWFVQPETLRQAFVVINEFFLFMFAHCEKM